MYANDMGGAYLNLWIHESEDASYNAYWLCIMVVLFKDYYIIVQHLLALKVISGGSTFVFCKWWFILETHNIPDNACMIVNFQGQPGSRGLPGPMGPPGLDVSTTTMYLLDKLTKTHNRNDPKFSDRQI